MSSPTQPIPQVHPLLGTLEHPLYVREQYKWKETKLVVATTAGVTYTISTKDAKVVMITTDSVIQYSVTDIDANSPQMAGTASTYDRLTIGVEKLDEPRILYFKLSSGAGNVWLVIFN